MTANQKDITQYACAVFSLVAGITLCYINFLMQGDVTNGVLGVMGMCMSFAGGVFGFSLWVRGKVTEVKEYVDARFQRINQDEENDHKRERFETDQAI